MLNTASGLFKSLQIPEPILLQYRVGKTAMTQQKYLEAIHTFRPILDHPNLPDVFQSLVYEQRGVCYWLLGNYPAAEQDFQSSLTSSNDPVQIARARSRLGDVADSSGRYDEATELYREALRAGIAANDLQTTGRAHRGLGIVNRRRGNVEQALNHLTQALAAFRQCGEAGEQARVLTSIGRTHQIRGEYQRAIAAHNEALKILEILKDWWRVALCLNDLGACYQELYALEEAHAAHLRALKLVEEHVYGLNIIKPEVQRNLGVDLMESGQLAEGLHYLEQSLAASREMGNHESEAQTLYHLSRAYLRSGRVDSATNAANQLEKIAQSLQADRYQALAHFIRGELYYAQNNPTQAVEELNMAMLSAQGSFDRGLLWKLHAVISHVVDNEALSLVHSQIAADFIRQTAEPIQDPKLKSAFLNAAPVVAILESANITPETF